jgi:hypothetical protein
LGSYRAVIITLPVAVAQARQVAVQVAWAAAELVLQALELLAETEQQTQAAELVVVQLRVLVVQAFL